MFRHFVCGLIALVLVAGAGFSADKAKKGKAVSGKFESFADGTLKIKTGKKNDAKIQEFKITDDVKVTTVTDGDKKQQAPKDAFKDLKAGTNVSVALGEGDKVASVTIGGGGKKAAGSFTSFKDGTLTLKVKNKKGEESKEFKIADDTKAVTVTTDGKKEGTAKDALQGAKEGTPVTVLLGKKGAVVGIEVGVGKKKDNK